MSETLERVLEEVKALTSEEQRQLRDQLERWAQEQQSKAMEDRLDQLLLEKGLISRIPTGVKGLDNYREFEPIPVEGKPVSETIIEDRR